MAEHPHVAIFRGVHKQLQHGNLEAAFDALDDDVVWHQLGAETLYGKDASSRACPVRSSERDAFTIDVHDVVGNDEHVIGLVETTLNMGGESFTYRTAEVAHMKDGKLTERWAFSDDTQRIIEFFGWSTSATSVSNPSHLLCVLDPLTWP
jgi:ketosteroid isomerase-like protein